MAEPDRNHDTELIAILDAAIDEFRCGAMTDAEVCSREHPELDDRGIGLIKTVRELALAAEDWREAARTIVGSDIVNAQDVNPKTLIEDTVITSQQDSDPAPGNVRVSSSTPERLGRYEIEAWVGSGAMGDVYRARDPQLDRCVALKIPKIERRTKRHQEFTERFLREARTAAAIRHPHICPIYDTGEHEGTPYVVMAFVNGESLAERLRRIGRYENPREAVELALNIAEALQEVHKHGIIHRDLKPGNILVDESGKALLTDFGLARSFVIDERLTADGCLVGTPAYMSPEQTLGEGKNVGPLSDLYGLGMVLYESLTGKLPVSGGAVSIIVNKATRAALASPASFRPELDPQLVAIVERAIQYDPDKRFPDAETLASALKSWLGSESGQRPKSITATAPASSEAVPSVSSTIPAPTHVASNGFQWNRHRWQIAAALCLICGIAVWFAIPGQQTKQFEPGPPTAFLARVEIEPSNNLGARPPLSGHLKIRFIDQPNPQSGKAIARRAKEGDATPLFNGQGVQLQVTLNRPAYAYVIWIDSDGTAQPIYPWDFGHSTKYWDAPLVKGSKESAQIIRCPQQTKDAFRATGKPGIQHVVLLARTTPLDSLDELHAAFSALPESPLPDGPVAARYFDWSPGTRIRGGMVRGLEAGKIYDTGETEEMEPDSNFNESDVPVLEIVKSRLTQQNLELIKVWRFAQTNES